MFRFGESLPHSSKSLTVHDGRLAFSDKQRCPLLLLVILCTVAHLKVILVARSNRKLRSSLVKRQCLIIRCLLTRKQADHPIGHSLAGPDLGLASMEKLGRQGELWAFIGARWSKPGSLSMSNRGWRRDICCDKHCEWSVMHTAA
jgi:hypothetical protein